MNTGQNNILKIHNWFYGFKPYDTFWNHFIFMLCFEMSSVLKWIPQTQLKFNGVVFTLYQLKAVSQDTWWSSPHISADVN